MNKRRGTFLRTVYRGLFISSFLQLTLDTLAQYTDSIIGGNFIGEEAVVAVGFVNPLYLLCLAFGTLTSIGCCTIYNRYIGKNNYKSAYKTLGQGLIITLLISTIAAVILVAIRDYYISTQDLSPVVKSYVYDYYFWFVGLAFLYPVYYLISNIVYSDGNVVLSASGEFVRFILNIVLSCIFISVFDMGLYGLSLATALSMFLVLLMLCTHFLRKSIKTKFIFRFNFKDLIESLKIGSSITVTFVAASILLLIINDYVISSFGDIYLVIVSTVSFAFGLVGSLTCVSNACAPIFCVYFGEQNKAGIKKVLGLSSVYALVSGILLSVALLVFADFFPFLFGVENEQLFCMCTFSIRLCSISFWCLVFLTFSSQIHTVSKHPLLGALELLYLNTIAPMIFMIISMKLFGVEYISLGFAMTAVTFVLIFWLYFGIRYGYKSIPFLIPKFDNTSAIFSTNSANNITEFNQQIESWLSKNKIENKHSLKAQLIIEEMFSYTKINNKNTVMIEVAIILTNRDMTIIYRDSGKLIDTTDDTSDYSTTIEVYVLDSIMQNKNNYSYLTTINHNKYICKMVGVIG